MHVQLIANILVLVWTAQQLYPATALGWTNPPIVLPGGARISAASLTLIGAAVAVYLGLYIFLRFTSFGIRMRAAGQNPLLAAQRGIALHGIYALAWGLATFTGGMAGMLIACDAGLEGTLVIVGLKAFPARSEERRVGKEC